MNPYIHAVIYTIIFWAQSTIKNAQSVAKERVILQELYDALGALLKAIPPDAPVK